MKGTWFPRLLGLGAALLALYYGAFAFLTPPAAGGHVALGHRIVGVTGWLVTAAHAGFFAWLAWACLWHRPAAVWGIVGYSVYLIENIWVYSTGEGYSLFPNPSGMLLTNALVTAVLLALCRAAIGRRETADR